MREDLPGPRNLKLPQDATVASFNSISSKIYLFPQRSMVLFLYKLRFPCAMSVMITLENEVCNEEGADGHHRSNSPSAEMP
jgi:hypothetical protein